MLLVTCHFILEKYTQTHMVTYNMCEKKICMNIGKIKDLQKGWQKYEVVTIFLKKIPKLTKNQTIRTKGPLRLPNEPRKIVTPRPWVLAKLQRAKTKSKRDPSSQIEHQTRVKSTPKIPNGFYYKNINFPSLIFRNPTKQPVWTRIKSRIEAHEWDSWPLTFKIDSKLDFFKNRTRKCKKNGVKVVVLNSYGCKWWF